MQRETTEVAPWRRGATVASQLYLSRCCAFTYLGGIAAVFCHQHTRSHLASPGLHSRRSNRYQYQIDMYVCTKSRAPGTLHLYIYRRALLSGLSNQKGKAHEVNATDCALAKACGGGAYRLILYSRGTWHVCLLPYRCVERPARLLGCLYRK